MKAILIGILTLFIGTVANAQSATASLNITITDVQSVRFENIALDKSISSGEKPSQNSLQVLSRSTSQIKKINSKTDEYEKLYKEFFSGTGVNGTSNSTGYPMAANYTSSSKASGAQHQSNLIIYQIDPR